MSTPALDFAESLSGPSWKNVSPSLMRSLFTLSRHLVATGLEGAAYGGGTFVTFSAFVRYIEEKVKLL
ncbi:hypothetical protein [Streptomyces sp. NPDC008141]|uniref:hypothetical protein n=1 Tax=Streptomyces sp. NPDC008141 TaxID=3364815 RepID=UPI0036F15753